MDDLKFECDQYVEWNALCGAVTALNNPQNAWEIFMQLPIFLRHTLSLWL